jgi:hypothetical protein
MNSLTFPGDFTDDYESSYVKMSIQSNILHCKYADNTRLSEDVARSCIENRIFLSRGKSYPVLTDMLGVVSTTHEASEYITSLGSTLVKAHAFMTGSWISRVIGNILLAIDRPQIPTRLFTSEEKAREWLKRFV